MSITALLIVVLAVWWAYDAGCDQKRVNEHEKKFHVAIPEKQEKQKKVWYNARGEEVDELGHHLRDRRY